MTDPIWIWAALGILLIAIEMTLVGTLDVLWFGIAALCVAVAIWLFPNITDSVQFTLFAVLALSSLAIWRIYYKKTETHSPVGQSKSEEIGRVGKLIESCGPDQTGRVQFTQGLMGAREWTAVSDVITPTGASVSVVAVEGNVLRVQAV